MGCKETAAIALAARRSKLAAEREARAHDPELRQRLVAALAAADGKVDAAAAALGMSQSVLRRRLREVGAPVVRRQPSACAPIIRSLADAIARHRELERPRWRRRRRAALEREVARDEQRRRVQIREDARRAHTERRRDNRPPGGMGGAHDAPAPPSLVDVDLTGWDWDEATERERLVGGGTGNWDAWRNEVVEAAMARRKATVQEQMAAAGRRGGRVLDNRPREERERGAVAVMMAGRPKGVNQHALRSGATAAPGEREQVLAALQAAGWRRTEAAKALGWGIRMLYKRIDALGIRLDVPGARPPPTMWDGPRAVVGDDPGGSVPECRKTLTSS